MHLQKARKHKEHYRKLRSANILVLHTVLGQKQKLKISWGLKMCKKRMKSPFWFTKISTRAYILP